VVQTIHGEKGVTGVIQVDAAGELWVGHIHSSVVDSDVNTSAKDTPFPDGFN